MPNSLLAAMNSFGFFLFAEDDSNSSELGFMAEKIFKRFSLFVNLENFTDTGQSRYKNGVNCSHLDLAFD